MQIHPESSSAEAAAPRIACLVPSVTELLAEIGLGAHLVARTGFCVHPAQMHSVPKVGGTKDVNLAKLRRLAPTHVVLNVDENRLETVQALRAWPLAQRPELIVTHPLGPEDVPALVEQLRGAFGAIGAVNERCTALIAALHSELEATQPQRRVPCAVLYLVWRDPWMTVARNTYIARLLARVHWLTLPAHAGDERGATRYPALHGDEAWLRDVQRVLLSSEPYRFDATHIAPAQRLCPRAQVQLVDGELLSWYGVRTLAGLRYARALADAPG
jgi:hypothetical protein